MLFFVFISFQMTEHRTKEKIRTQSTVTALLSSSLPIGVTAIAAFNYCDIHQGPGGDL